MGNQFHELECHCLEGSMSICLLIVFMLAAWPQVRRALKSSRRTIGKRASLRMQRVAPARYRRHVAKSARLEVVSAMCLDYALVFLSVVGARHACVAAVIHQCRCGAVTHIWHQLPSMRFLLLRFMRNILASKQWVLHAAPLCARPSCFCSLVARTEHRSGNCWRVRLV